VELTVLGASGRTGIRVLRKALEAGHAVRAVVRDRARLEAMVPELPRGGSLTIVEADLLDGDAVREALAASHVVIYAAGPVKGAPADMPIRSAENVVAAMKTGLGEKLVWLTGAGVLDERDGRSASRNVIRGIMKLVAGKVLTASEAAYEVVKHSGLTYVVARPPMLAEAPGGIDLTAGYEPPRPIPLGRGDLGAFLVEAATSDRYDNESPFLSYRRRGTP
jgi:nucleoside-diphosphate-sugar epimerase